MKIKYLGPAESVNVEPHGPHRQGEVKDYPADFGEDLLATSKKQQFELVGDSGRDSPPPNGDELTEAATAAVAAGKVTADGKPEVKAMEEILGRNITEADRDRAWEQLQTGND